ncbi:hypothetical protein D3C85_1334440 [compost metagenome]
MYAVTALVQVKPLSAHPNSVLADSRETVKPRLRVCHFQRLFGIIPRTLLIYFGAPSQEVRAGDSLIL